MSPRWLVLLVLNATTGKEQVKPSLDSSPLPCDIARELGLSHSSTKLDLSLTPELLGHYVYHLKPCYDELDEVSTVFSPSELPKPVAELDWLECTNEPVMPLPGNEGMNVSWDQFAWLAARFLECRQFHKSEHCDPMNVVLGCADAVTWNEDASIALEYQDLFAAVLRGDAPKSRLRGICYYGIVASLFVRAVHQFNTYPGSSRGLAKVAFDMLGGDILSLDLAESTRRWKFLHGAIVEQALTWMSWEREHQGVLGDDGFMLFSLYHPEREPLNPALGLSADSPTSKPPSARKHVNVDVFIGFSFHFGYIIQQVSMLLAALPLALEGAVHVHLLASSVGLGGVHGGAPWNIELTCKYLGVCSASDGAPEIAQFSKALDKYFEIDPTESYLECLRALSDLGKRYPALHDSIIVDGGGIQVAMMSAAFPRARFLMWMPLTPIITRNVHLLGKPLLLPEVLHIMHIKEIAQSSRVHVLVTSEKIEEDLKYLAGISSEVVLAPSLFMLEYRRAAVLPDVLLHGRNFLRKSLRPALLPLFAPGWNFVRMDQEAMSFERMGEFFATVFFPHNIHLLGVMDLYAACVPIFKPSFEMMLKIERLLGIWGCRNTWAAREPFHHLLDSGTPFKHPWSPFWDGAEHPGRVPPTQFGYWWQFSEFSILPHLIQYASLPDLAAKLHSLDRPGISAQMRKAHARFSAAAVHRFARGLVLLS